jgi:hypothetical protein
MMKVGRTPVFAVLVASAILHQAAKAVAAPKEIKLTADGLTLTVDPENARYGFEVSGKQIVAPDGQAGILLAGSPVSVTLAGPCKPNSCLLQGISASGEKMRITWTLAPHHAQLEVEPEHVGQEVRFVTGGAAPAYGLADHAVEQNLFSTLPNKQFNTDVTGFADDRFLSGQGQTRLVSNFVIYPKQGFGELLIDPTVKIIHTSGQQIVQGVLHAPAKFTLHYFFGTMHDIYAAYLQARNEAGYRVIMPKYDAFGVGWEAFGALAWDTDQVTVSSSIDHYLSDGYPLRWVVIGSAEPHASPA